MVDSTLIMSIKLLSNSYLLFTSVICISGGNYKNPKAGIKAVPLLCHTPSVQLSMETQRGGKVPSYPTGLCRLCSIGHDYP